LPDLIDSAPLPPELDPFLAHEATTTGWRGLTPAGEVFEVTGANGHLAERPAGVTVMQGGQVIGYRALPPDAPGVADYLAHCRRGVERFLADDPAGALVEYEAALALAPTTRVRFNRALALLALGRWREGFEAYEARHEFAPATRMMLEARDSRRWLGEDLCGRRLALVHDAGFGDTIMLLRYVPLLRRLGARVSLVMPPELAPLAAKVAPLAATTAEADYYCGMLSLLHWFSAVPIPPAHYLAPDPDRIAHWQRRLGPGRKVGVAWSVGRLVEGDYPRALPLAQLLEPLEQPAMLVSLQQQGGEEAAAAGVLAPGFSDFADCAALASQMDEIITVDTAAAHVAGAIGHPAVTLLLRRPASWRWRDNRFYSQFRIGWR